MQGMRIMNVRSVVLRETAISVAINTVLSILFFLAVFGLSAPVTARALGPDFLPQALMVALMGSLVPGLLTARRSGAAKAPVVRRAILLAIGGLVVAGGGAWLVCSLSDRVFDPVHAMLGKAIFGAGLAAIVTPVAVCAALQSAGQ